MVTVPLDAVVLDVTAFVAVSILVSGLDDFTIDVVYYATQAYRFFRPERYREPTEADLRAKPEQAIAIMIPAWHEYAVIAHMLKNTLRTVEYSNYQMFVGVYPNDEATMLAVAEVAEQDPRVRRIVLPHDGPTNKADCLNWIIEGIRHRDKETGRPTEIFMLHDSEDLVHPLSFKIINYHIPDVAMVQLPVVPIQVPLKELTAGTYLDEFAESHIKDMVVRERLSGMVPSAGVGTGFSRAAVEKLAKKHDNQIFNLGTFTEDYDLAFRLHALGERSILVKMWVDRTRTVQTPEGERLETVRELVGTREYFPDRFKDAVRQKARWTLGIVFHGWQQRGWEGGLALRYMIWRDRKTLMTNTVNMIGYLLLVGTWAAAHVKGVRLHRLPSESWVWKVILTDTMLLANRCVQRYVSITRVADWRQGLLAVPRIVWGNVINFFAVAKATRLFLWTAWTGKKPVWAKTDHAFPTEAQLVGYKRKLGDLLLERHAVTLAHLGAALAAQKEKGGLLGDLLVDMGFAAEDDVVAALAVQQKAEAYVLDPAAAPPDALSAIGEHACREHLMIVARPDARPVVIACADTTDRSMRKWLDANFKQPYRLVLSGRRSIVAAIDRLGAAPPRAAGPFTDEAQLP